MADRDENVYLTHQLTIEVLPHARDEQIGTCSCGLWSYSSGGIHGPRRIGRQHDRHLEEAMG